MYKKNLPKAYSYIVLIACMLFIILCIINRKSLAIGFASCIIFTSAILLINGYSLKEMIKMILPSIKEAKMLYIFILLIGAAVSVWLASGVVPALMYYGFEYMKGMNFLLASFLIISITSIFMGTSVGTISTIGIALLGVGRGFGIPPEILIGVLVSGAFTADKMSPVSGLVNLTLATTKVSYRKALKAMLPTFMPVYIISASLYYIIGKRFLAVNGTQNLSFYQQSIKSGFFISPYLMLIPVVVLLLCLLGMNSVSTISVGILLGIIISIIFQHIPFGELVKAIFIGYHGTTGSTELNSILISGGIKSMVEVVLIVMGAVALASLLEKAGIIIPIIEKLTGSIKTKGMLIFKTGMISMLLTAFTCDQTVGIILPGRLLQGKYKEFGIDNSILARTISDTGTIIAPLMAWNVNTLIITPLSGVSAWKYAPYAVLCYLFPIISMIISSVYFYLKTLSIRRKGSIKLPFFLS